VGMTCGPAWQTSTPRVKVAPDLQVSAAAVAGWQHEIPVAATQHACSCFTVLNNHVASWRAERWLCHPCYAKSPMLLASRSIHGRQGRFRGLRHDIRTQWQSYESPRSARGPAESLNHSGRTWAVQSAAATQGPCGFASGRTQLRSRSIAASTQVQASCRVYGR
jgi:hypothetical protein